MLTEAAAGLAAMKADSSSIGSLAPPDMSGTHAQLNAIKRLLQVNVGGMLCDGRACLVLFQLQKQIWGFCVG